MAHPFAAPSHSGPARTGTRARLSGLREYNLAGAGLHAAQAVAVVVLASRFALPVRATHMTGPPGAAVGTQTVTLFHVRFGWAIAAFFALSALAHLFAAGPGWTAASS